MIARLPDPEVVTAQVAGCTVYTSNHGVLYAGDFADQLRLLLPDVSEGFISSQRFVDHQAEQDARYKNIPAKTQQVIDWCETNQLPVFFGPNTAHTLEGCEEAVLVRDRIIAAQESVPVYDELKTLLWTLKSAGQNNRPGETLFVATHIRGNRLIGIEALKDWLKVEGQEKLGLEFSNKSLKNMHFVSDEALKAKFGLEKGQVTPWIEAQRDEFSDDTKGARIIHIFDTDCSKTFGMGMTTNAHDGDWATEFDCAQVIAALQKQSPDTVFEASIVDGNLSITLDRVHRYQKRVMGILEYGIEATMLFRSRFEGYRKQQLSQLTEPFYQRDSKGNIVTQDLSLEMAGTFSEPSCKTASDTKLERVMRPDLYAPEIQQRVNHLVRDLVAQGANTIMIPCNILPKYITEMFSTFNVRILRMDRALWQKFGDESIDPETSFFLGGSSVHHPDLSIYKPLQSKSIEVSEDDRKKIDLAMMRINNHSFREADEILFEVLKHRTDIRTLVLCATSFSVAFAQRGVILDPENFSSEQQEEVNRINHLISIDTLDVYAQYCAERMLDSIGQSQL